MLVKPLFLAIEEGQKQHGVLYLFRFLLWLVFIQKLSFGVGDLTAGKHAGEREREMSE